MTDKMKKVKKIKNTKKKKLLVIRSVSFQQLDKNILRILERFPVSEYDYSLLTHTHGTNRARKYEMVTEILDYGSRGNFSFFHIPSALKGKRFDTVVVPVTNITGTGFLNVLSMTLRLKTGNVSICNLVSEFRPVSRIKILSGWAAAFLYTLAAGLGTVLLIALLPLILLVGMLRSSGEKKAG